jgi:hypothetical protein
VCGGPTKATRLANVKVAEANPIRNFEPFFIMIFILAVCVI